MTIIAKRKILIVDDNDANLFSLVKIIERLDQTVHTASSGQQALDLSELNDYSLILLDIQMPKMDGFETLERLRKNPKNLFVPVILISAIFTEDQYKLKGILNGAVDFIPKPVEPNILRAKVNVFLELDEHKESLKQLIKELNDKNEQLKKEISKRKKIEEELRKAKSKAEASSELKTKLLVNMSHEIRTPVNSILGFADLIANPDIQPSDKERYVKYVSNSSQNLLFLIDEILDHSRIESGEFKINSGTADLNEILEELRESFEHIKNQQGKSHIQIFSHHPDKNQLIKTDPQRLKQVYINLLSNAMKYTKKGQIDFGYEIRGNTIKCFVRDTGIGIEKSELKNVFNRFKRVETQESLISQGTGLGLSIVSKILELLKGEIQVRSEQGKGSEFIFTIPYESIDREPKGRDQQEDTVRIQIPTIEEPDWSNYTLLIAEDEEMNFLFLQETLRPTGIKILWAKNGRNAVRMAVEQHPDLVLMDIKMPDINGFEAISLIREKSEGIHVIIQTAFAKEDSELKKWGKKYNDLVTKPINRNVLISTMSKYLL